MAGSFDHHDKDSWYFGPMSRQDATDLLMSEKEGGVFLVRDSASIRGDFVLCVREDSKVSHYIINKIQQSDQTKYRIGDQVFTDLPNLLAFYKLHYLDTTPLIRPATHRIEKVIAKFDFVGVDSDDLPFKKGEILTIISKDEDQWWTAQNNLGQIGSIPVPYVQKVIHFILLQSAPSVISYEENNHSSIENSRPGSGGPAPMNQAAQQVEAQIRRSQLNRKLPALARVKQARVPNAYDKTALKLEVGDMIKVTKININGQWEGELRGKIGHFPFTHVEFVENDDTQNEDS